MVAAIMLAAAALPGRTAGQEKVTWLVIAAPNCDTAVSDLVKHRQNQGESVKVVKVTDIISQSGLPKNSPVYKKIWDYLNINYKEMELDYCLLVGNDTDIPMPKLYPADNQDNFSPTDPHPLYSDFYYQCLGIDWDKDKDGRLGEPKNDSITINPTISVGRIPFSEPVLIDKICQAIVGYDTSPYRRSIAQAGSMYLYDRELGDPYSTFTDGSDMMEKIWGDILLRAKFLRKTLYEEDGLRPKNKPLPKYDRALDSQNLIDIITNQDFGMLNILAHGETDRVNRKVWYNDENNNGIPDKNEIKMPELLSADQIIGKTVRTSVVISTACSTGSISGGTESLGTAFMRQGASAFIGATAMNYFMPSWKEPEDGGNQTITYNLTKHYCNGESLGWSLARTMKEFYSSFATKQLWADKWAQNVYSFILLGDPAMRLEPIQPKMNMPMNFDPPSLTIPAGEKDQVKLSFGIQSSRNELSLSYSANPAFTVTFSVVNPLPGQTVNVIVSVPRSMIPGNYEIEISCLSSSHKGKSSFGVKILPPESGPTEIIMQPEYVYAVPKQEFWVDIIIKPTQPVRSMSGKIFYDSTLLELVDKRLGDFATFDYLCPEWQVVDLQYQNQISFSFFRNSGIGATSTDVAVSLCFRGKKESTSDIYGLSFDIKTPANKSQIITGNPSTRVKVHPQGLSLTVSSKPTPGNDRQATLYGSTKPNQQLTIDGQLVTTASDGKFSKVVNLSRFKNDFVVMVNNQSVNPVDGTLVLDRVVIVRKLVIWPSRKELAFVIGSKNVWNNGNCSDKLNSEPLIISGSTMVPWRYISEQLGFIVGYDVKTKKITANKNGTSITMTVGQKNATVNGKQMTMQVPPTVRNGTTYVPLRFVGDSINAGIKWLPESKTALIYSPK